MKFKISLTNIGGIGFLYCGDDAFISRIERVEGLAAYAVAPFVVDQQLGRNTRNY